MELVVALLLIISCLILLHRNKLKREKNLQQEGVVNITHIKALISFVQIHRGLSSAWLNGDKSKRSLLSDLEKKINTEIIALQQQIVFNITDRWIGFTDHWMRLKRHQDSHDAENSFKQHTQMISGLLYLLEDEAERSHLNATYLQKFQHIGFVWRELIGTTEIIGQSRAIGTGVATKKQCSSVHKIRLSFLQQHMQKTLDSTLPNIFALDSYQSEHESLLEIAKSRMLSLNLTIEKELINAQQITINQDEYFALATDSISALNAIFDHQIEQIKSTL